MLNVNFAYHLYSNQSVLIQGKDVRKISLIRKDCVFVYNEDGISESGPYSFKEAPLLLKPVESILHEQVLELCKLVDDTVFGVMQLLLQHQH